jgi:xylose dehydrogenase (NAD/NADP)
MKNKTLKWGILGTAKIAQDSLVSAFKASRKNELYAVASRSLTKAEEFARLNLITKVYGTYDELLQDSSVQAVYIPLPNSLHKLWAIEAMKAGKHVLCEKPIGLNEQEAREMVAVAEEKQVVLMEGFMYRYPPRFAKFIKIIQNGSLGNIRYIHSAFTYNITNPDDIRLIPELGGGALMDVGCYCIDFSRQITSREPISVQAQCYQSNTGIDLQVIATLDFGDNIYSVFEAAFNTTRRQLCHIAGTEGTLEIIQPFKNFGKGTKAILTTAEGVKTMYFWGKDEYSKMLDQFQRMVARKAEPLFPLSHSINDMKVIDAIVQSMHNNGKVIKLNQPSGIQEENVIDPLENKVIDLDTK